MIRFTLVGAILLVSSVCFPQPSTKTAPMSKTIDAPQLLLDLKSLSADDMQGRLVGTPGSAKAREYIIKRFKDSGISPFGDSYSQPFEFSYPRKPEKIRAANVVGYIKGD